MKKRPKPVSTTCHVVGRPNPPYGLLVDMIHGYTRVSTTKQSDESQRHDLVTAGAERIWAETASGVAAQRPVLEKLVAAAQEGDTIVVWRLDRLGRSMTHLIDTVNNLDARGIAVHSLHEKFDTRTANGRLMLGLFALLSQFERDLMRERTKAGLEAAALSGKRVGRPPKITGDRIVIATAMATQGRSVADIARAMGVSRATVYRMLADHPSQSTGS